VKDALVEIGVEGMTITEARGHGREVERRVDHVVDRPIRAERREKGTREKVLDQGHAARPGPPEPPQGPGPGSLNRDDRGRAQGKHLDIPAGTAVRFEPGESKTVQLVPFAGAGARS